MLQDQSLEQDTHANIAEGIFPVIKLSRKPKVADANLRLVFVEEY